VAAAGLLSTDAWLSLTSLLADMMTTPDSLLDLLDRTQLTSGLLALLGSGGNTLGDWLGFDCA